MILEVPVRGALTVAGGGVSASKGGGPDAGIGEEDGHAKGG
jgi:hypothetical protein